MPTFGLLRTGMGFQQSRQRGKYSVAVRLVRDWTSWRTWLQTVTSYPSFLVCTWVTCLVINLSVPETLWSNISLRFSLHMVSLLTTVSSVNVITYAVMPTVPLSNSSSCPSCISVPRGKVRSPPAVPSKACFQRSNLSRRTLATGTTTKWPPVV